MSKFIGSVKISGALIRDEKGVKGCISQFEKGHSPEVKRSIYVNKKWHLSRYKGPFSGLKRGNYKK